MKNIILAGNPNCGKTTLFNTLTKSRQATGNRPGVTVNASRGTYKTKGNIRCTLTDLPGTYNLPGFTAEETEVSRFLESGKFDGIICVVDSLNPLRSIKLLLELKAYGKPVTAALNFCDLTEKDGISVNTALLEKESGVSVVKISAAKGTGLDRLMKTALSQKESTSRNTVFDTLAEAQRICEKAFVKTPHNTAKVWDPDRIVLNRYAAVPFMLLICAVIFGLTFSGLTGSASEFIDTLITEKLSGMIRTAILNKSGNYLLCGMICDGALKGVGTVTAFLPQITMLTFLTALFEDSGLLARCAYIFDKPLKKAGLQGKCFYCLMMGFGCTVPAAMSTRILESRRDKIKTLLLLPFIPCSAKLPLILMLGSLFSKSAAQAVILVYSAAVFTGIIITVLSDRLFKDKSKKFFLLELPPYRLPGFKSIKYAVLTRISEFLLKAGTLIFIGSILLWAATSFTPSFTYTADSARSIIALAGQKSLFLFSHMGITDWRQSVSLISGIIARESIVSSLEILYNNAPGEIADYFDGAAALSFCMFSVLFIPCVSALISIKKELKNNRVFFGAMFFEIITAFAVCTAVFQIGRFFI